jgi:hypothetical protein
MTRILELDRLEEFEEYREMFEYDEGAFPLYNNVLYTIKNREEEFTISEMLGDAINFNKHVLDYLTGKKEIPTKLPETHSYGDDNEAIYYSTIAMKA